MLNKISLPKVGMKIEISLSVSFHLQINETFVQLQNRLFFLVDQANTFENNLFTNCIFSILKMIN
jgi:hypothetical protein